MRFFWQVFFMADSVLYMLATPIGNLQDVSLRALRLLREAAVIAAEDTRVARRLLSALDIPAPARLLSARAHNEQRAAAKIIAALEAGESVVYVSDAGTPAVSDPGSRIAQAVRKAGFAVSPVPGASALTALLSAAALPEGAVHFYGFPPPAAARRRKFFAALSALEGVSVFYEAPHRIAATVAALAEAFGGGCRIVLGRELTKRYEQIVDSTLAEVADALARGDIPARGEFALAVENPAADAGAAEGWQAFAELEKLLPPRKAAAAAAAITGADAAALYKRHLAGKKTEKG